jgi:hypothetical protein
MHKTASERDITHPNTAHPGHNARAEKPSGLALLGQRIATFAWFLWGELTGNKRIFPS